MRKTLLTTVMTLVWLLASPTLQIRDSSWIEVGAPPAAAETTQDEKKKTTKKVRKPARLGSAPVIQSNAPGLYPMQPINPPQTPNIIGTVSASDPVPGYPQVPTVAVVPRGSTAGAGRETSQDRVARCTHQAALGGLPSGEQGAYIHSCAFQ